MTKDKQTTNKTYRSFNGTITSSDPESRIVEGFAVRFNEPSQFLGFYETIERGAITEETLNRSDIFARLNHREDTVLARSRYGEGTLALELRDEGLFYRFEAPNTQAGDELLEHIRRGEISTSSFAFTVDEDDRTAQRWYKENGELKRNVMKIERLYDVSPTFEGAYLTTSCYSRDKAKAMEELDKQVNKKMDELQNKIEKL